METSTSIRVVSGQLESHVAVRWAMWQEHLAER